MQDRGSTNQRTAKGGIVTEQEKEVADRLLSKIEVATGELPTKDGVVAQLITEIVEAVGGLRTLIGVSRPQH